MEQIPNFSDNIADFFFRRVWEARSGTIPAREIGYIESEVLSWMIERFKLTCQKEPENQEYSAMQSVVPGVPLQTNGSVIDSDGCSGTFPAGTRKTLKYKGVEFVFCYCPAGSFIMGSPSTEIERFNDETQHKVILTKGFWMQETELTQEQWKVLGVRKKKACEFKGKDLPVETVSWKESVAYISKLNELGIAPEGMKFSLPTEAQWEYACRAGTTTAFFWGDSLNGDKANCNGAYPYGMTAKGKYLGKTAPVKCYEPNPWGLYDMYGNVWEWTSDWYGTYPGDAVVDPAGATGTDVADRVIRGGSWNYFAKFCRSACRFSYVPVIRLYCLGFRLVLE